MAENAGAPPRLRAWPPHGSGTDPAERPATPTRTDRFDGGVHRHRYPFRPTMAPSTVAVGSRATALTPIPQRFQSDGELLIATLADVRIVAARSQTLQKCVKSSEIPR